ncbi:hypothetical protein [Planctomicrobium sp. SH527]|uniref:hypothetical protein n=1 Tax=Planctomicrobium sp. SH527 TaxID=3448123 RepID=UPI003F5C1A16
MDRLELTPEQREQIRHAEQAGKRRIVLEFTPEQRAYQQRIRVEEEAAAQESLKLPRVEWPAGKASSRHRREQ